MGTEEAANVKCEDPVTELEGKIIRQVEYYFGDYNLKKDKFLMEKMKENDGWISMEILLKFNRLKQLSDDSAVITDALKKSPNQLMEVSEDGTMIRRSLSKPLPDSNDNTREEVNRRSIYVKGFKETTSLDELLDFFKPYKNPENIYMRRKPNKKFKGSVFVTFKTEEDAEAFLEMNDVKFNGVDLLRERKPNYLKRKGIIRDERRKEKEERIKRKSEEGQEETREKSVSEEEITRGCLLKLVGLTEKTMREDIKKVLEEHGKVVYIDYSKGQVEAVVRFEMPVASEVLEKATVEVDGVRQVKIDNADVTATLIEGEQEVEYWKSLESQRAKMRGAKKFTKNPKKGWTGRNGKHFRGKGKRGRKMRDREDEQSNEEQSGGDEDDEPSAKVAKVDQADESELAEK